MSKILTLIKMFSNKNCINYTLKYGRKGEFFIFWQIEEEKYLREYNSTG